WGYNKDGSVGIGTITDSEVTPKDVVGIGASSVVSIGTSTCAVTSAGGAKGWGDALSGALGNGGTDGAYDAAVDVTGLTSGVASISAGTLNACAVTTQGTVKCWGNNAMGALGNGSSDDSAVPIKVSGLSAIRAVSMGQHFGC